MESMESGSPVSTRAKSALTLHDMARRSARNSRVHFTEDGYIPQLQEANPILVQVTGEEMSKTIGVYLGFLQEEHKYDVKFTIPLPLVEGFLVVSTVPQPNPLIQGQIKIQDESGSASPTSANSSSPSNDANSVTANGASQSGEDSTKQTPSSSQNIKFAGNLELFGTGGEFCQVTGMEWGVGKAAGLHFEMCVTVPSTNDHHVLEDTFCIRSASVADRFVRVNVAAKIMGKTMGTPTLKDGIKCIGVCPTQHDSSDSSNCSENENEVDMKLSK